MSYSYKHSHLYLGLVLIAMVGCAVTPPPPLPAEQYRRFAVDFKGLTLCGETGNLDADTVAYGQQNMRDNLARYTFDQSKLNAEFAALPSDAKPTQEQCNRAAIAIAGARQRDEARAKAAAIQREDNRQLQQTLQNMKPKQTYCNKVGTQTMCSTY